MNPPVRDASHKAGIWKGLEQGVVDVLGSDHAPHTLRKAEAGLVLIAKIDLKSLHLSETHWLNQATNPH